MSGKMIHELIRVCKCGFEIRGRSGVSSDAMLMAVADRCVWVVRDVCLVTRQVFHAHGCSTKAADCGSQMRGLFRRCNPAAARYGTQSMSREAAASPLTVSRERHQCFLSVQWFRNVVPNAYGVGVAANALQLSSSHHCNSKTDISIDTLIIEPWQLPKQIGHCRS
jgi:hypothetical protein